MTTTTEPLTEVNFTGLAPGCVLQLETKTRRYRVECLGGDEIRISGHPDYCPVPVQAKVRGSINRQGVYKTGLIAPGMRLMFRRNDDQVIATSEITAITLERAA